MRKKKPFLAIILTALLLIGGYSIAKETGLIHPSSQLEQPPKLAEGIEDGSENGGGELEGDVPGSGNAGGSVTVPDDPDAEQGGDATDKPAASDEPAPTPSPGDTTGGKGEQDGISRGENGTIAVIAQPDAFTALVNPFNKLPEDYEPDDLVYPDVKFIFSEKVEKRMMRKEAAEALEQLFEGAECNADEAVRSVREARRVRESQNVQRAPWHQRTRNGSGGRRNERRRLLRGGGLLRRYGGSVLAG
ncbi:MAG: peptidase [Paenibacillus sp.]|nr:peptidase [Paenibacillus sp.]